MLAAYSVSGETSCITGCTCELDRIFCFELTALPQPFKTSARRVEIYLSLLPEIPSNAFKDAPNVEYFHFRQVSIGVIKPCAFPSSGTDINFDLCEIGTIEANAFNNIHGSGRMDFSLSSSTISRIESFAFTNVQGFKVFQIHSIEVELIQSFAMYKFSDIDTFMMFDMNVTEMQSSAIDDFTNVTTMDIYHATFNYLECNTVEKLRSQMGKNFSFHSFLVNCDCGLVWLLEASQRDSELKLEDVMCYKPASLHHVHLKNLTTTDLCSSLSVPNCQNLSPTPPKSCISEVNAGNTLVSNVFIIYLMCYSVSMLAQ
ncbi:uncharacterized protein LOC124263768 [Haliotis rubra]|uniref:uncharacterized protein LOC124263768 n=1 Tax=Haliotis rubra TaxID=36100 RepID=UPI001EE59C11|nr:uncharacterized protein LOC124263768 [Haliotis rubra]